MLLFALLLQIFVFVFFFLFPLLLFLLLIILILRVTTEHLFEELEETGLLLSVQASPRQQPKGPRNYELRGLPGSLLSGLRGSKGHLGLSKGLKKSLLSGSGSGFSAGLLKERRGINRSLF